MIQMNIEVKGLNEIKKAWAKRPEIVKKYMNKAIEASMFQLEKDANDNQFQFKTPRALRTGMLQLSFKHGIISRDLFGSIGPTVNYAPKVHQNNPFMPRIAQSSQPYVQKYFEQALGFIVEDLAKG